MQVRARGGGRVQSGGQGKGVAMEYRVTARRVDAHGSLARAKAAEVVLDTDLAGRSDAMNPVELLLAARRPAC